jgi:hypothetical protein
VELVLFAVGLTLVAGGAWTVARRAGRAAGRPPRVDPFTVGEPWRNHVTAALAAQRRFDRIVAAAPAGPLRERMTAIGHQVGQGVTECYEVARRGHRLDDTIRALDRASLESRLATTDDVDVRASLEAQLASADRLRVQRDDTERRLRVLQTRLGEITGQAAEIATGADRTDELGSAVNDVVEQLEALRLAVAEFDRRGAPPT